MFMKDPCIGCLVYAACGEECSIKIKHRIKSRRMKEDLSTSILPYVLVSPPILTAIICVVLRVCGVI